jgi:hypothetical protein
VDTIELEPLDQVGPIVENQPDFTGWHGGAQGFAVGNQFRGGACFVAIFEQSDASIGESGAKALKESGAIHGRKYRSVENRINARKDPRK